MLLLCTSSSSSSSGTGTVPSSTSSGGGGVGNGSSGGGASSIRPTDTIKKNVVKNINQPITATGKQKMASSNSSLVRQRGSAVCAVQFTPSPTPTSSSSCSHGNGSDNISNVNGNVLQYHHSHHYSRPVSSPVVTPATTATTTTLYRCTTATGGICQSGEIVVGHHNFYETDQLSRRTSWEFRCDNNSGNGTRSIVSVGGGVCGPPQIMLRSPPALLSLNLRATGGSSSSPSATSSLSTTPSPLEEQIPGQPYHIHFSPNTSGPPGTPATSTTAFHCASVSACACCGGGNVTLLLGGGGGGEDPLDLSEGSRTSTGSSHRSQDSGFSDSGETKRERRAHSQIASPLPAPPQSPVPQTTQQVYGLAPPSYHHPPPPPPPDGEQIYECVGPPGSSTAPMPSPIPPAGFGCGRFPLRPASVDISTLHSPTPPALPTNPPPSNAPLPNCIDCLSCSTPLITLPPRQRRSFSPSALASSSTQTALAALRVPLSCSTPKRGASSSSSSSASTSRLLNGNTLKIDNFESLNKNAAMNKDNNNNSSSNSSSAATGKSNKTYTLVASSGTTLSCLSSASSTKNGTVLAEEHSASGNQLEKERAPGTQVKRRTAAESIYDKICNRLSSFSSSTSSAASPNSLNTVISPEALGKPVEDSHESSHHFHPHSNLAATSKFRVFTRSSSAKWQSLPRGIGALKPVPPPRANLSAPPTQVFEEEEYHEERPIDVPQATTSSSTSAWREAMARVEETQPNPVVRLWLNELRTQTEPECLHSLQNKWILPLEEDPEEEGEEAHPRSTTSPSSCVSSSRKVSSSSSSGTGISSSSPTSSSMPSSSTSSYARRLRRQEERRSQQRFLSSMTAAIHAVSTPLMSIRTVEMTASVISAEFSKICKHLEFGVFTQVPTLVMSLVGHIQDMLRGVQTPSPSMMMGEGNESTLLGPSVFGVSHLKKLEGRLEDACFALSMAVKGIMGQQNQGNNTVGSESSGASIVSSSSILEGEQYQQVIADVVQGIVTVGNLFSEVVDLRLTRDLGSILDTIEAGGIPARIALKSLVTVLADGGNHICRLAADIRTVRGLLGVMLDTREDQDKMLALRCLATVLCVGEAVKDFDKAGGFEIIADILSQPVYPLSMKMEAVAVLTQATDPWIDLESTLMTLGVHLERFIVALTNLIGEFKTDEEPFLLIVAAISNLTFLEVASTEHLKRCRTVSFLIDAVRNRPYSVFVLDHVATILANMAGVESCRQEIVQCGGIDAILHFLQQRPNSSSSGPNSPKMESASAITACERLQQKSTIALSRLASEEGVARYVFQMGGVHRLVSLCRKDKERNYSDGVLIAALATLRKLVTICGGDALKGLRGAEDLIEPRLLDSFLLYSSRQESYV